MLSRKAIALSFIPVFAGYAVAAAFVLDRNVRERTQPTTGINAYGYQGQSKILKRPDERRIALVGGSAAFGYGVEYEHGPASVFANYLNQGWRDKYQNARYTVAGLAEIGAGAGSYVRTLEDYAYLDPDAICLYDGYAPVEGYPALGVRRESVIFRTIGYLPTIFDSRRRKLPDQVPMDPHLRNEAAGDVSCAGTSSSYCAAIADAVAWGLARGKRVVVVTPPFVSQRHQMQQESLAARLAERFAKDRRFSYVNLGRSVDMHDLKFSFDGVHLTTAGVQSVADQLVDTLFDATRQ